MRSLDRRRPCGRTVVLLLFFALVVPLVGVVTQGSTSARAATSVRWGAVVQPRDGRTEIQETTRMEAQTGRRFAGLRNYYLWDTTFPTADDVWIRDTGHEVWLSVKAARSNGTVVPWASIGAATPGTALYSDMLRWAQRIKDFGAVTHVIFNHEPEAATNVGRGNAADFVAAWRNWVGAFRAVGVPNARFTWTATAYGFRKGAGRPAQSYYPGDAYVDEIGADDYNWLDCRDGIHNAPRSFAAIFNDFRTFGAAHPDHPLVIPEWASAESGTPADKAAWITDARQTLKRPEWGQVSYVNYYHGRHSPTSRCLWYADTTPESLAAFVAMGQDPYFADSGPTPDGPPTARSTVSCSGLVCTLDGRTSSDAEGPIADYRWDFGDGQTGSGAQVSHTFAGGGTFRVTLTVTDAAGAADSVSRDVPVVPLETGGEIAFHGLTRAVGNLTAATLAQPADVRPGDALLLFATVNQTSAVVSAPAGWTPVANVVAGSARTLVWTASAGATPTPVQLQFDRYTKTVVELLAYGGTSATDPVAAVSTRSDSGTLHTTPTVTAGDREWLVSCWADKSSTTTTWTAPGGVAVRDTAIGTGSGYITSLVGDSGGPVPSGPAGGLTATTNAASGAATVSLLLQP